MLKKYLKLMIFMIFTVLLSGCSLINLVTSKTTATTATTVQTGTITYSQDLLLRNLTTDYTTSSSTELPTYQYSNDPGVVYVNIEEFIRFLQGEIVDLSVNKTNVLTLYYTINIPKEDQTKGGPTTYTYNLIFDAAKNEVKYSDFDLTDVLDVAPNDSYQTSITLADEKETDSTNPSLTIDLSKYNMNIELVDGNYYLPFYLANLFLTGPDINLYDMGDYAYLLDNTTDLTQIPNYYYTLNNEIPNLGIKTENYLALYFDYYYGLKNYHHITSYASVLSKYDWAADTNGTLINYDVNHFISYLNDLHTSIVVGGYDDQNYQYTYSENEKTKNYLDAYMVNECYLRDNSEISTANYGDTFVIQVNDFSLKTRNLLVPAMLEAESYNNIVLDLGCNQGGNLIGVMELAAYMTDKNIPLTYINPQSGTKITDYYDTSSIQALHKNFYVYTTNVTYSAANLFTSIVKDNHLGIVFGENTGGGASAIDYTVLPDGAIIVTSSDMTLLNQAGQVIEDGIPVDVNISYPFNWDTVVATVNEKLNH